MTEETEGARMGGCKQVRERTADIAVQGEARPQIKLEGESQREEA